MTRLSQMYGPSVSRFDRRLHTLRQWLFGIICLVTEIYIRREAFIVDSMPLPACNGQAFCGYCAAKIVKLFD